MFSSVVTRLLNLYLGKYVSNLNDDNLNIGILNGDVELVDLEIKTEALFELDLPIEVKAGNIGKVQLRIPWRNLSCQPVVIRLEDIMVLAGPIADRNYDPNIELRLLRAAKSFRLQQLEGSGSHIFAKNDDISTGFWEKLSTSIMSNVQIFISNIHVSYEDVITNVGKPFICGLILHNLTAETTNQKWKTSQVDANANSVFKLIKLESLSMYWNSNCKSEHLTRNHLGTKKWKELMKKGLETFSLNNEDFEFILKPVSAKVKIIINKSNEAKVPKLLLDFVLQDVACQLSKQQYNGILALRDSFKRMTMNRRFLIYRPETPVAGHATDWWHYALIAWLEEYLRPHSWKRILRHRRKYRRYRDLYKQRLRRPDDQSIRDDLQDIEDTLDTINVLLAREEARIQYTKEEPNSSQQQRKVTKSWWKIWASSDEIVEDYWNIPSEMNDGDLWTGVNYDERQQLFEAIGYSKDNPVTEKPKQYIEHKFNFTFANCSLSLFNDGFEVLVLSLTQFLTSVETRPSAEAFRLSARTESFLIEGMAIEHDLVPIVSADNLTGGTTIPYVFALDFEKNPQRVNADYGLTMQTESIEAIYQEHAFSEIINFFQSSTGNAQSIVESVKEKGRMFGRMAKNALNYTIEKDKKCYIAIDMKSPYLIIPEHGTMQKGGNVLILDFGRLTIKSDLQEEGGFLEEATKTELEERLYDRFLATIADIQVLFADSGDEWRAGRMTTESESHLVPKFRIQIVLANSVSPLYKQLPRQKINISLASAKLNLSDGRVRHLFEFLQNVLMTAKRMKNESSQPDRNKKLTLKDIPDIMDMNNVLMEPNLRSLHKIRHRILQKDKPKSPSKNEEVVTKIPRCLSRQSGNSSMEHSDEESEEWAQTVDLPGFEDNVSPHNVITCLLRFVVGEIVIQLARSSDHVDKPYLMLRTEKICVDLALMEFGPAFQASLGTIQLVDKLHMGLDGEYLELITSNGNSTDTITILYRKVRSDCPDFRSHFHQVEQSVVVSLNALNIVFHRGAFLTLCKYLQYVIERIGTKKLNGSRVKNFVKKNPMRFLATDVRDPPVPSGATKYSISLRMDEIRLRLCDSDMDLTEAKIAGLETDLVLKANEKIILRAYLNHFSVEDLSDMTLYTKILSIVDDKVFDLKYVRHSSCPSQSRKNSELMEKESAGVKCDASIRLRIGRMQICFLSKFFLDLQRFLEPFSYAEIEHGISTSLERAIQERMWILRRQGTRVTISVDIHAPIVYIPQKSDSPNLLVFRIGDLNLENFFKEVKAANGQTRQTPLVTDNILIRLNSLQMNRAVIILDGSMEELESIIEPLQLRVDIKRAIPPFHRDLLIYDIRGNMDIVKVNLSQRDLGLLLAICKENLVEGQFLEKTPGYRPGYSPVDTPSPINATDDTVGKKLQAFFNTSVDVCKETNFMFKLEGAELTLFYDTAEILSSATRCQVYGLSKFLMDEATLSLEVFSDRTLEMKCALQALALEDIRQESRLAVTKVFQSYSGDNKMDTGPISVSMPPMIDVSYKQSQAGDVSVDILIEKTRLNLSVPYVLALAKFVDEAWPSEKPADGGIINQGFAGEMSSQIHGSGRHTSSSENTSGYYSTTSVVAAEENSGLTVTAKLKKPEVVLFADPTDKNSRVLVLKADLYFDYNQNSGKHSMVLSIAGLRLLSCVYGKRKQTAYLVLQPCDIEFTKTIATSEDHSCNIRASMSTVDLRMSASTVHTLRDVAQELIGSIKGTKENVQDDFQCHQEDHEIHDLWAIRKIPPQKWLPQSDDDHFQCVRSSYPTSNTKENIFISVSEIQIVCELEDQSFRHVPVILLRTGFEADAHNWTKQLSMKAELRLELSYFNEKLSAWEPLIEPVMQAEDSYRPWELLIKAFHQSSRPVVSNSDDDTILGLDASYASYQNLGPKTLSDSSSDEDSDSDQEVVILKKPSITPKPKRIHAQKSYDTGSLIGYPMDSDSENEEGVLEKLTTAFGHMFSSESSDDEESSESEKDEEADDQTVEKSEDFDVNGEDEDDRDNQADDEETETAEEADTDGESGVIPNAGDKPIFLNKQPNEGESVDSGVDVGTTPMATYILIDSRDKFNVTLTPAATEVIMDVIKSFTSKTMPLIRDQQLSIKSSTLVLKNKLGPGSKITVIEVSETGEEDEAHHIAIANDIEEPDDQYVSPSSSGQLVDITPTDSEGDVEGDEDDRFSISSALTHAISSSVNDTGLEYEEEDLTTFYREIIKQRINISVEGFNKLQCFMPRRASTHIFALHPQRNDTRYHVVVNVDVHNGQKIVQVTSPLQIVNELSEAVNIYYDKKILDNLGAIQPSHPKNPFEDKLYLITVQPQEIYNVPFYVAYHCKLFIEPAYLPFKIASDGIWWQELSMTESRSKQIICLSKDANQSERFSMKVSCENGVKLTRSSAMSGRLIPNYSLHLWPSLLIRNNLPYTIELFSENSQQEIKLEPGQVAILNNIDLNHNHKIKLEMANYLGLLWMGTLDVSANMDDHRTVRMTAEFGESRLVGGETKQLTVSFQVERKPCLCIDIYVPYWIINKTGLPLQLRGSGSGMIYENNSVDEPLLFRFKRHRRRKAKMRVYNSRWSVSFSLDTVASSGLIICKDREREKKHQFLMTISLSKYRLTKIVVISPYFMVINDTTRDLRFMEHNDKADLWVDISHGQSLPFWPDTNSFQMHVKFRDSNVVSQSFHIDKMQDTVLRMDHGSALCVSVKGGTEKPMTITVHPYLPGRAPVIVENWCEDLFLKIHQKSMGQVALLSPYQSVLYTWDDPTKERTLMWNIYNRSKPGFPAFIWKDGWGEEKLSFHTLRPTTNNKCTKPNHQPSKESSSDEDDSENNPNALPKKTRKDKVVVYWVSYMEDFQRVLLFTQDERISKLARKGITGSKSNIEFCVSMSNVSLSVINGNCKEVAYVSLSDAPAIWHVEVNHRWKMLPLELSSWLEDKWKTDQYKTEIKEYIQVDFNKMQMTKPFYGRLHRHYFPAIWCQYRRSKYLSYLNLKLHRLQIDNQLPDAIFPTVFSPASTPPFVVRKSGIQPFIEVAIVQRHNDHKCTRNIKYLKALVQEVNIRLDKGFLLSFYDFVERLPLIMSKSKLPDIREDLKEIRQSSLINNKIPDTSEHVQFEYIHLSPLKINFSYSPRGNIHRAGETNGDDQYVDIIDFYLETVGATVAEIKDVEIRLAYYQSKGAVWPLNRLFEESKNHYINQILQQFYVLVLELPVLGNPYSIVQDFTKGLGDLYYEPFLGTIRNPEEYAESVSNGMKHLLGHATGGNTLGSITSLTESLSTQASTVLLFEEDYKRKRRQRLQQQKSALPDTVSSAFRTFSLGVSMSLSGVFVKLCVGAQQDGIEAFFKSTGKGILSMLTRQPGGLGDTVDMAYDGIRRAAEMGEEVIMRMRLPRYINQDMGVRPYSPYMSVGLRLLLRLSKGHYASSDVYWAHAALKKEDRWTLLLVTDRRIFELTRPRPWAEWDILWKVNVDEVMAVPTVRGRTMILKVRQDESCQLFPGDECYITCNDTQVLHWLQLKIEKVLIAHMEARPCPAYVDDN